MEFRNVDLKSGVGICSKLIVVAINLLQVFSGASLKALEMGIVLCKMTQPWMIAWTSYVQINFIFNMKT